MTLSKQRSKRVIPLQLRLGVGVIGYYVGAVLSGEIDMVEILARRSR